MICNKQRAPGGWVVRIVHYPDSVSHGGYTTEFVPRPKRGDDPGEWRLAWEWDRESGVPHPLHSQVERWEALGLHRGKAFTYQGDSCTGLPVDFDHEGPRFGFEREHYPEREESLTGVALEEVLAALEATAG